MRPQGQNGLKGRANTKVRYTPANSGDNSMLDLTKEFLQDNLNANDLKSNKHKKLKSSKKKEIAETLGITEENLNNILEELSFDDEAMNYSYSTDTLGNLIITEKETLKSITLAGSEAADANFMISVYLYNPSKLNKYFSELFQEKIMNLNEFTNVTYDTISLKASKSHYKVKFNNNLFDAILSSDIGNIWYIDISANEFQMRDMATFIKIFDDFVKKYDPAVITLLLPKRSEYILKQLNKKFNFEIKNSDEVLGDTVFTLERKARFMEQENV